MRRNRREGWIKILIAWNDYILLYYWWIWPYDRTFWFEGLYSVALGDPGYLGVFFESDPPFDYPEMMISTWDLSSSARGRSTLAPAATGAAGWGEAAVDELSSGAQGYELFRAAAKTRAAAFSAAFAELRMGFFSMHFKLRNEYIWRSKCSLSLLWSNGDHINIIVFLDNIV